MPEVKHENLTRSSVWDRITALSSLILAAVGLIALIFTWRQLSEMREESRSQIAEMHAEAQVQHLVAMTDRFDSTDRLAIRKALAEKRVDSAAKRLRPLDPDSPPVEFDQELAFCDDIGLLTDRGYLDRHDVWSTFGQWLFYLYTDARPYLDSLRSQADYAECKNLVESIRPIETREGDSTYDHPSESDLYSNYMDDIESSSGPLLTHRRQPRKP